MRSEDQRRYPPSPFPPRSEATRIYRDSWDQGWDDYGRRGRAAALEFYAHLTGPEGDPRKRGYRDGALARRRSLERAATIPDYVRREEERAAEEVRRRHLRDEKPL